MSSGVTNSGSLTIPRELWERSVLASHPVHESYPPSLTAPQFTLFHFIPATSDGHWLPLPRYPSPRRGTPITPLHVWRISPVQFPWRLKVIPVTSTRPDVARPPRWILHVLVSRNHQNKTNRAFIQVVTSIIVKPNYCEMTKCFIHLLSVWRFKVYFCSMAIRYIISPSRCKPFSGGRMIGI